MGRFRNKHVDFLEYFFHEIVSKDGKNNLKHLLLCLGSNTYTILELNETNSRRTA